MRRGILTLATAGLLAVTGLTACGGGGGGSGSGSGNTGDKKPKIGVILPDSKSSARWETADRKFLESAFKSAGSTTTSRTPRTTRTPSRRSPTR